MSAVGFQRDRHEDRDSTPNSEFRVPSSEVESLRGLDCVLSCSQSGDGSSRSERPMQATDWQDLGSQRKIRHAIIDADLVEGLVAPPSQLFDST